MPLGGPKKGPKNNEKFCRELSVPKKMKKDKKFEKKGKVTQMFWQRNPVGMILLRDNR